MFIKIWIVSILLILPAILCRLWFLAHTPIGALFYYSNILKEFGVKRLNWHRETLDLAIFGIGTFGLLTLGNKGRVMAFASLAVLAGLEIFARVNERQVLVTNYAHLDRRSTGKKVEAVGSSGFVPGAFPRPCPHPDLVINFLGPFISRIPEYDLGCLVLGRVVDVTVLIGNHSPMITQTPIKISVKASQYFEVSEFINEVPPISPGIVANVSFQVRAVQECESSNIFVTVQFADTLTQYRISVSRVIAGQSAEIKEVRISRYPGGCRSAFAWRGDMDLYDLATFQSIEGLTATLQLAARYRFPQTMFMSSRLTVDSEESAKFFDTMGVKRGQDEVNQFIRWFGEKVELRHEASYPFESEKPFLMELGNHHHLHYGTDAAAAEENEWRFNAGIGSGNYSWTETGATSFNEQRDNAVECARRFEKCFGFVPKSWTMPDSTRDEYTPQAIEAAGCEVFCDSDAGHRHNVLFQPLPHHPQGCNGIEITRRYPGDPDNFYHLAMIKYWMHRAHRRGIPVVFMCHQHLRQFAGYACSHFTEAVIRYSLTGFHGDLWVNTVYGIGAYWGNVISPKTRTVNAEIKGGEVLVRNLGDASLVCVPVDVTYHGGGRATFLVDLAPRRELYIRSNGLD